MSVEVRNLTKRYGRITAVSDLSFRARDGRVTGFLGPNGAGKSTTLRCVAGLARPDAGAATIDGVPLARQPDPARRVGVALDPNSHHPDRSGRDHLRFLALAGRIPAGRVDDVLRLVELGGAADRRAGTYSLGMRQRLHLAAALLGDPGTLVLDEPANGLDPQGIRWLRDFLRALAAEGRCVLLTSPQLREVAQTVDEVVVLAGGRLAAAGTVFDAGRLALRVRTPDPGTLSAALRMLPGAGVTAQDGTLRVTGLGPEDVARTALDARLLVTELVAEEPDLEAAFFRLTGMTS